ncbi:hypothetical protein K8S17_04665 [bacterium]|nr:hypothetical protein [bacterium]
MTDNFDDSEMAQLLAEENEKLAQLRELVDGACDEIMRGRLDRPEATVLIQRVRRQAQEIIPGMMDRFDLIYQSRFERLISQHVTTLSSDDIA